MPETIIQQLRQLLNARALITIGFLALYGWWLIVQERKDRREYPGGKIKQLTKNPDPDAQIAEFSKHPSGDDVA